MVRKVLIGLVVALVFLGPGIALVTIAAMVSPAVTEATACGTSGDTAGLSGPSLSVTGTVPNSLTATTADGQTVTLDQTQLDRAATIIAVGNSENIDENGQLVALMAALTESTLRVLANTTAYPQSASYPNDGDGDNDDSLGLFQMQPPDGWGTVAQLMDPVWSSGAFYGGPNGPNHGSPAGLLDIPNWQSLSLGAAAQAVEDSAYPDRYANYQPVAEKIASTLTGVTLTGSGESCSTTTTTGNLPPGFAGAFIAVAEQEIGLPYVWGGGTYTGPSGEAANGEPGFDCSGLVLYAAYQASGGKVRLLHYTGDQINETQPVSWADKQPGDIIFYTYPGDSEPHHVVIYLGGNRILQAPETGQNVGYGTLSEFPGQIATVRRIEVP